MAFCEISTSKGHKCINIIKKSAKICKNNILSCPDDPSTVPCPDLEPLIVTMIRPACPVSTIYGSPPTFTARSTKDARIRFYLNDELKKREPGLSDYASFTPDANVSVEEYSIKVAATRGTNYDGTEGEYSESICTWTVLPPLTVEFTEPSGPVLLDTPGATRSFTAETNKDATLQFFVDEIPIESIQQNPRKAILSNLPIDDGHTVEVLAITPDEKSCEVATASILWIVVPHEDTLIKETEWNMPSVSKPDAYMKIKSLLYQKENGDYYVNVMYVCFGCTFVPGQRLIGIKCNLSLDIKVSWDPITMPNFSEKRVETEGCNFKGLESFSVPSGIQTIHITSTMGTFCAHTARIQNIVNQELVNDGS